VIPLFPKEGLGEILLFVQIPLNPSLKRGKRKMRLIKPPKECRNKNE
jgi:hypothetical protein